MTILVVLLTGYAIVPIAMGGKDMVTMAVMNIIGKERGYISLYHLSNGNNVPFKYLTLIENSATVKLKSNITGIK